MSIKKIEHIGIAVKDLKSANAVYEKLLGVAPYKQEEVKSEQVLTSFFQCGDVKIELLEAGDAGSVIARFLEKRGEGLHHVAFDVEDIVSEMARLKSAGFKVLSDTPRRGADNKLVCFVHPKDCAGVLVELCQEISG